MTRSQRDLLKLFLTSSSQRVGNMRDWLIVRKSDGASQIVTIHCMCSAPAAIDKAVQIDDWNIIPPSGASIVGLQ